MCPRLESPLTGGSAVRDATAEDAAWIARIYNHYVEHTVTTFEEAPVTDEEMAGRIVAVSEKLPWLVLEADGEPVGYAYATDWKSRSAYRYTAEVSVYVAADRHGRGHGTRLYAPLFDALRERGLHAVIAGITLPNPASVAFHERFGFRYVGRFAEVGRKFDRWVDVGYWMRLL